MTDSKVKRFPEAEARRAAKAQEVPNVAAVEDDDPELAMIDINVTPDDIRPQTMLETSLLNTNRVLDVQLNKALTRASQLLDLARKYKQSYLGARAEIERLRGDKPPTEA